MWAFLEPTLKLITVFSKLDVADQREHNRLFT